MAIQPIIPTGVIMDYAGTTEPAGWLFCDGRTLSRTGDYAGLFSVLGTTHGAGSGDGLTFSLPDLRGRATVGPNNMGTARGAAGTLNTDGSLVPSTTVGSKIGWQHHTLTPAQTAMKTHSHGGVTDDQDRGHTHTFTTSTVGNHAHGGVLQHQATIRIPAHSTATQYAMSYHAGNTTDSGSHNHTGTTDGANTGHLHPFTTTTNPADANATSGHSNVQPSYVIHKIIKL